MVEHKREDSWRRGESPLLRGEASYARGQGPGGRELEMKSTATLEATSAAMHSITLVGMLRFGCTGQRGKERHRLNQEHSRNEYIRLDRAV